MVGQVRRRNPKQHQIRFGDLFPLSGEQVVISMPVEGWSLLVSLLSFYGEWRTQYAAAQYDGDLYQPISDEQYRDVANLLGSIPGEEFLYMGTLSELLENLADTVCSCVAGTVEQATLALQAAMAQQVATIWANSQVGDEVTLPPDSANPRGTLGDERACLLFQAYLRWADGVMRYIVLDTEYEYLVSMGVVGLLTLIPPTAGLIVPIAVVLAITAIAMSHFWQLADQQDYAEFVDSRDEILCILYNAESAQDAQRKLDAYAADAGWTASFTTLFKTLFCPWASSLFFSGVLDDIDTTGLEGGACDECVGGWYVFDFAPGDANNEPFACGVYYHEESPPAYDPSNEGCCADEVFDLPERCDVIWTVETPIIPSTKSLALSIKSDECSDPIAAVSFSSEPAGTHQVTVEGVTPPYLRGRVFVERGTFSLSVYRIRCEVVPR